MTYITIPCDDAWMAARSMTMFAVLTAGWLHLHHFKSQYLTNLIISASPDKEVPRWWCTSLLAGCQPLPDCALELQESHKTSKLRRTVVGQGTQQQLWHVVDMGPAVKQQKQCKCNRCMAPTSEMERYRWYAGLKLLPQLTDTYPRQ